MLYNGIHVSGLRNKGIDAPICLVLDGRKEGDAVPGILVTGFFSASALRMKGKDRTTNKAAVRLSGKKYMQERDGMLMQ